MLVEEDADVPACLRNALFQAEELVVDADDVSDREEGEDHHERDHDVEC